MYKKQMFYDILISTAVQIISIKNKYYHKHAHLEKKIPLCSFTALLDFITI